MQNVSKSRQVALILLVVLGLVGLGLALYELISPASGTTGSPGAIIVTVSTMLLSAAALLLVAVRMPGWLFRLLLTLAIVDAAATAAAAYFLMANFLVAAMLAACLAVLVAAVSRRGSHQGATA